MGIRMRARVLAVAGSVALVACATPPNGVSTSDAIHTNPASAVAHADAPNAFASAADALPASPDLSSKLGGKTLTASIPDVSTFSQKGRASWYGGHFNGRKTANGERYDMNAMTAAHRTLPMSAFVRVTNESNGKSIVVKINDRGPFHRGRIIDLSRAAALALGMQHSGTSNVKIQGLSTAEATAAQSESLASAN
ncbi:septal ring lytic transglycosylase RlpA family protein [Pararobbsia silviterrae]